MSFLDKLFGNNRSDIRDAQRIYQYTMKQSRHPDFFGTGRFPDNYDGRIDCLTLNLATIMHRLRAFDVNGARLSQALFDVLKDDFEIALREEGLSDKGVAKRIKPMIQLFYTRLKTYDSFLNGSQIASDDVIAHHKDRIEDRADEAWPEIWDSFETIFQKKLTDYMRNLSQTLYNMSLGEIALTRFAFPNLDPDNSQS